MDQATLRQFESLCTQEEPPACQTMCPLHVEARAFLALMAQNNVPEARKMLERTMPLAGLTGYLCDGDCLAHCVRNSIDTAVHLPLVERACLAATQPGKPFPLPATGKHIAVAGSDLSSLCVAWELAKKGHSVTLFHTGTPGASLHTILADTLPAEALEQAIGQLRALRVTFTPVSSINEQEWVESLLAEYQAVYLGIDDTSIFSGQSALRARYPQTNPLTLETPDPKVFCGGDAPSRINTAAQGKRAAGSIDRLLQGVAPTSAREKEAVYPTRLHTETADQPAVPAVMPHNPFAPTPEEGQREAARCIQCECLECVKHCPYLAHYKGYPKKYAREMYNNLSVIHGVRQTNQTINSCAECGLCEVICPTHAHMGSFCAAARQEMVVSNRMPPSAHEFALEDMAFSNSDEAAFTRHQPGHERSAFLFFPGCQLPASMPKQTEALYVHLCSHLQGGVGFMAGCCGAPAKWSGRAILTQSTAQAFHEAWQRMEKPVVLTACASCLAFMQQELPHVPCRAVWDELAALPLPEQGQPETGQTLALHDPCATRKEEATRTKVRRLLHSLGQQIEELPLSGSTTRCCGYGGLAAAANPAMGTAYAKARADDTELPLLAYCSMCRDRLAATGKACLHILDLLFPQTNAATAMFRPAPGISARQNSRAAFRLHMLHALWQEAVPSPAQQKFTYSCAPGVAEKLEERRIRHADIEAVLAYARANSPQFYHAATNRFLAALRPRQVTFWLEYEESGKDTYIIHDAYCHRMVVPGVEGEGLPSPCTREGYAVKGGRI